MIIFLLLIVIMLLILLITHTVKMTLTIIRSQNPPPLLTPQQRLDIYNHGFQHLPQYKTLRDYLKEEHSITIGMGELREYFPELHAIISHKDRWSTAKERKYDMKAAALLIKWKFPHELS